MNSVNNEQHTPRYDFLIFGAAGIQGRIVTRDLAAAGHRLYVSDLRRSDVARLRAQFSGTAGSALDLRHAEAVTRLVRRVRPHVVINCAEGDWNPTVYRAALAAGTHVIDLGSDIPETREQLAMHSAFKKKGLTAITGCGSTPGINNVMLAYVAQEYERMDRVQAGFVWDSNRKEFVVPFSMESIIEEFTVPATSLKNGHFEKTPPLESVQRMKFRGIERQRCFYARHPEVYTFHQCYRDKGLRTAEFYAGFPDHSFDFIAHLAEQLDERRSVAVPERGAVPLPSLTRVLEEMHPIPEDYQERENLWVIVDGVSGGQEVRTQMECLVPTVPGWEEAGCNIDTGFPASIIAQMLHRGAITERGSFEPGPVVPAEEFFRELEAKGMKIYRDGRQLFSRGRMRNATDALHVSA